MLNCSPTVSLIAKVKTLGDAIILASGLYDRTDPDAAVQLAQAMREAVRDYFEQNEIDLDIRIGVGRGSCSAGVMGELRPKFDLWGPAVVEAERLEREAQNGTYQLSEHLYESKAA